MDDEKQTTRKSRSTKRKNSDHDEEPIDKNKELGGLRNALANNKCKESKDKNDELRKENKFGKKGGSDTSKKDDSSNEIKKSKESDQQEEDEPETSHKEDVKGGRVLRSSRK